MSQHPLLIPELVSKILEPLPLKTILDCRSVCLMWNAQVIRHLEVKMRVKVQFEDYEDFSSSSAASPSFSSSSLSQNQNRSMSKFTQLMESSLELPFKNYILNKPFTPDYHLEDHPIQRFLAVCGPEIKSIQISLPNTLTTSTFIQILKHFGTKLPKLQSLHLVNVFNSINPDLYKNSLKISQDFDGFIFRQLEEIIYTQEDEPVGPELPSWVALFKASPKFKRLGLSFPMVEFKSTTAFGIIQALLVANVRKNLKQLSISGGTTAAIDLLTSLGLTLEELSLTNLTPKAELRAIRNFLTQQNHLVKLEFGQKRCLGKLFNETAKRLRLPLKTGKMDQLTTLILDLGPRSIAFSSSIQDLPNLKHVEITDFVPDMVQHMSNHFRSLSVTTLKVCFHKASWRIQRSEKFPSQNVILSLQEMFPNVQNLILNYPTEEEINLLSSSWVSSLKHFNLKLQPKDYKPEIGDLRSRENILTAFPKIREIKGLKSLAINVNKSLIQTSKTSMNTKKTTCSKQRLFKYHSYPSCETVAEDKIK